MLERSEQDQPCAAQLGSRFDRPRQRNAVLLRMLEVQHDEIVRGALRDGPAEKIHRVLGRTNHAVAHAPGVEVMRENFALSGMIIDNQDAQIGQIVRLRRPPRDRLFLQPDREPKRRSVARCAAGSISDPSSTPLPCARWASSSTVSSTTSARLKSSVSKCSLPASILEKSRMSLMTVRSRSPLVRAVSTKSRCS